MDITVVNAVVCNRAEGHERYTLHGVGSKWSEPPSQLAVWIELHNPAERAFSVGVSLWRGQRFIDESPGELVLKGHP